MRQGELYLEHLKVTLHYSELCGLMILKGDRILNNNASLRDFRYSILNDEKIKQLNKV